MLLMIMKNNFPLILSAAFLNCKLWLRKKIAEFFYVSTCFTYLIWWLQYMFFYLKFTVFFVIRILCIIFIFFLFISDHKDATESSKLSCAMKKATLTAQGKSENAIQSAMRNVFFAADANLPSSVVPKLNEHCIKQVK